MSLAMVGGRLAVAAGDFSLCLSECLLRDDSLVVILYHYGLSRRNSGLPDRPLGLAGKVTYLLCWVFGCQGATRILIYAFGRMHQGCFGGLAGFPWVERKSIPEALFLAVASDALLHYAAYVQDKHRHIFRKSVLLDISLSF